MDGRSRLFNLVYNWVHFTCIVLHRTWMTTTVVGSNILPCTHTGAKKPSGLNSLLKLNVRQ